MIQKIDIQGKQTTVSIQLSDDTKTLDLGLIWVFSFGTADASVRSLVAQLQRLHASPLPELLQPPYSAELEVKLKTTH